MYCNHDSGAIRHDFLGKSQINDKFYVRCFPAKISFHTITTITSKTNSIFYYYYNFYYHQQYHHRLHHYHHYMYFILSRDFSTFITEVRQHLFSPQTTKLPVKHLCTYNAKKVGVIETLDDLNLAK